MFQDAQNLANKDPGDKKIIFYLDTEAVTIPEEASAVPETVIPTQENPGHRQACYLEMVDEALLEGAERLDMSVRLWQYNLMHAMAEDGDRVQLQNVHLKLDGHHDGDLHVNGAEVQTIQVSRSYGICPGTHTDRHSIRTIRSH